MRVVPQPLEPPRNARRATATSATAKCASCHSHLSHREMRVVPQPLQPHRFHTLECTSRFSHTFCGLLHALAAGGSPSSPWPSASFFPPISLLFSPSFLFMPPRKPRKKPASQTPADNDEAPLSRGKRAAQTRKRNQEEREALHIGKFALSFLRFLRLIYQCLQLLLGRSGQQATTVM
jgi:hypothetical protein